MILSALDSVLNEEGTFEVLPTLACLGCAILAGFILLLVYRFYKKKQGVSRDMPLAILLMPIIVEGIVLLSRLIGLSSTAARTTLGFSFAGILAITRFRSTQKDATDLIFLSASIVLGFVLGLGYLLYAAIILAAVILIIMIAYFTKITEPSEKEISLKITVPESLNYENAFTDILEEYTYKYALKNVKTSDFGTMFELSYILSFKDLKLQKEFIDKLRERNGNLDISFTVRKYKDAQ